MSGNSNIVTTNQDGVHPDLEKIVQRHCTHPWRGPIHPATQEAFDLISVKLQQLKDQGKPWILDSGCGVGESTRKLAKLYPNHFILGVDRSEVRLSKAEVKADGETGDGVSLKIEGKTSSNAKSTAADNKNYQYIRAELGDLWRLLNRHNLKPEQHYILYPNPNPKKLHIKRRFHGDTSFREILDLCPNLELRSNWRLYLEEFQYAAQIGLEALGLGTFPKGELVQIYPTSESSWTLFEKKFVESNQEIYALKFELKL